MTFNGIFNWCWERPMVFSYGVNEVFEYFQICSGVIGLLHDFRKVEDLLMMISENINTDFILITSDFAFGKLDFGCAIFKLSKNIHRHKDGSLVVHLHEQHLIVNNIVIAMVNATAMRTSF